MDKKIERLIKAATDVVDSNGYNNATIKELRDALYAVKEVKPRPSELEPNCKCEIINWKQSDGSIVPKRFIDHACPVHGCK